jgi:putative oxidoreductase
MSTQTYDAALLILRVSLGLTMAAHGYGKFFTGGRIAGTAGWFESIGMRPGKVQALLAASTEVGSGLLMVLGLLTPLAGAAFVSLMFVAAWTVHRNNGFFIVKSGWEYNFILAIAGIAVAMLGPGEWSVDHAIGLSTDFYGWTGLAVSAGGGFLAGAGLLALCYRPPAS